MSTQLIYGGAWGQGLNTGATRYMVLQGGFETQYAAGELSNLAEDGFISNTINGSTYWLHIYTADPVICDCCTNIQGTFRSI